MLLILKQRYETDYILYRSQMKMGNIYLVLYLTTYGNNQSVISPGAPSKVGEKLIVNEEICILGHHVCSLYSVSYKKVENMPLKGYVNRACHYL